MPATQKELAELTNLSQRTISNLETGRDVSFSTVIDVLRALGQLQSLDIMIPEQGPRPSIYPHLANGVSAFGKARNPMCRHNPVGNGGMKFDGVDRNGDKEGEDVPQYTRIEYAYYLMAKNAGILMNECRLFEESGRYHFMTRRFDRDPVTGAKYHMQSLGGMAHFDFNMPGAYSYEQAVEVMRRLRLSNTEISQFFRRMVFNVLMRNQDDHVKNISFLMDRRGQWRLAPAYDMTYAYNPDGMWTGTHQMSVNGKRDDIAIQDLLLSARSMGIRKAEAERIITEIQDSRGHWMKFAEDAAIQEDAADQIQRTFPSV